MSARIIVGDCVEAMAAMDESSVHAIVTDPPYGLGFMGRDWDNLPPGIPWARQCLRVLKPGGHLLAFGGTRTSHRLVCAIEDAGFEIRDSICWLYGSGFPKALNLNGDWQGWGTALKPAHEPIVVARKPLDGTVSATVLRHGTGALNVDGCRVGMTTRTNASAPRHERNGFIKGFVEGTESVQHAHGRWPSNVVLSHAAACQPIGTRRVKGSHATGEHNHRSSSGNGYGHGAAGRIDSRVDADGTEEVAAYRCAPDCPVRMLDEQTGNVPGATSNGKAKGNGYGEGYGPMAQAPAYGDSGGASRFFPTFDARHEDAERRFLYQSKASSAERNAGLDRFEAVRQDPYTGEMPAVTASDWGNPDAKVYERRTMKRNVHPTVKPIALMRWLVRLVTPPGGTVLDPFAGSGTTGCAAALEGFDFIGIEREAEYAAIAEARIAWWSEHPDGMELVRRLEFEKAQTATTDAGQCSFFDAEVA